MFKAGAIAGVTAFAFGGVNNLAPVQAFGATFDPTAYAENVAGSALVGCAASGGSCGSGAAAAAVSAGLTPVTNSMFQNAKYDIGERIGGTIAQATAGGLASVAGGGKFANGAVTGAFQYLVELGPVGDPRMGAFDAANYPPPPTKSTGFPNSQIADGEWTWSEDANNGRGGVYRNGDLSASWEASTATGILIVVKERDKDIIDGEPRSLSTKRMEAIPDRLGCLFFRAPVCQSLSIPAQLIQHFAFPQIEHSGSAV
jgi:hypothetical protein